MPRTLLITVGGVNVFGYNSNSILAFEHGLSIDADGSPHAYHPTSGMGLDFLANAGSPGNWWGILTKNGEPLVQTENDPAPGFYISTTSLEDATKAGEDPMRFVNSEEIPFVALPHSVQIFFRLGDIGYAYNKTNKVESYFIFADIGPGNHIGEGSMKLAQNLGVNSNPKHGGINSNIVYILFTNSGDKHVKTEEEINTIGPGFTSQFDIPSILNDF